jgi:hypothetical protein
MAFRPLPRSFVVFLMFSSLFNQHFFSTVLSVSAATAVSSSSSSLPSTSIAAATAKYVVQCDAVFCQIIDEAYRKILPMRRVVEAGTCVSQFGNKADEICNTALDQFSHSAPVPAALLGDNSAAYESLYDKKVEDIERILDAPLHVLYLKQLALLREKALKYFQESLLSATVEGGSSSDSGRSEFEALTAAEELFRRGAEEYTRTNSLVEEDDDAVTTGGMSSRGWGYIREAENLKQTLLEIAKRTRKLQEVRLMGAKQTQQAMQYLQQQQQQLQAIQAQVSGSSSPWNMGCAYRVPDTNFNLACSYQQGKASIQLSCVPDESVPLLGPNGFVNGVTPGNVGLSFNINI